jgi:hypothetical protein
VIEVTVNAKDMVGEIMDPLTFRFRIQTDEEIETEAANLPETLTTIDPLTSMKRTTITSGPLSGASIVFSTSLQEEMGFEPYFGPLEAIPFLAGLEAAGTPLNLLPHTLFTSPVTLVIPCPENENAKNMAVYYHDGRAWWLASDREGNVLPNGEGWMVSGSRINHEQEDSEGPDFIEIQVYHFSAAAAASPPQFTLREEGRALFRVSGNRENPFGHSLSCSRSRDLSKRPRRISHDALFGRQSRQRRTTTRLCYFFASSRNYICRNHRFPGCPAFPVVAPGKIVNYNLRNLVRRK